MAMVQPRYDDATLEQWMAVVALIGLALLPRVRLARNSVHPVVTNTLASLLAMSAHYGGSPFWLTAALYGSALLNPRWHLSATLAFVFHVLTRLVVLPFDRNSWEFALILFVFAKALLPLVKPSLVQHERGLRRLFLLFALHDIWTVPLFTAPVALPKSLEIVVPNLLAETIQMADQYQFLQQDMTDFLNSASSTAAQDLDSVVWCRGPADVYARCNPKALQDELSSALSTFTSTENLGKLAVQEAADLSRDVALNMYLMLDNVDTERQQLSLLQLWDRRGLELMAGEIFDRMSPALLPSDFATLSVTQSPWTRYLLTSKERSILNTLHVHANKVRAAVMDLSLYPSRPLLGVMIALDQLELACTAPTVKSQPGEDGLHLFSHAECWRDKMACLGAIVYESSRKHNATTLDPESKRKMCSRAEALYDLRHGTWPVEWLSAFYHLLDTGSAKLHDTGMGVTQSPPFNLILNQLDTQTQWFFSNILVLQEKWHAFGNFPAAGGSIPREFLLPYIANDTLQNLEGLLWDEPEFARRKRYEVRSLEEI